MCGPDQPILFLFSYRIFQSAFNSLGLCSSPPRLFARV
jgi:hypothetical protein